jgi:predicted esterase
VPSRPWPLLLVFDPRGRGRIVTELFRDGAEEFGWVVASSNDTRSESGWEPNGKALQAMWPGVPARVRVDPRRVYAAGFSGTVYVAWRLGQVTSQLAGIIGTGSGPLPDDDARIGAPAFFGAAGLRDFNYLPMKSLAERLGNRGIVHRLEFFDGAHEWFPPAMARDAIAWLEVVAMRGGSRSRDEAVIAKVLAGERTRAESLEQSGRLPEAVAAFDAIARTFDGFADVGFARDHARRLESGAALKEARRAEKRWADWEQRTKPELGRRLTQLLTGEPSMAPRQAAGELGVPGLASRAARPGPEGEAASRLREWAFAQASFYLWRDMMEQQTWSRAIFSQLLALEIRADAPVAWYRLAAAQARAGQKKQAVESLDRAIAGGFRNLEALVGNADFEAIKDDPAFLQLVERVRAAS